MRNTEVATMQPKEQKTVKLYTYEEVEDIFKRKFEQKIQGFGITAIGLLSVLILKDGTFACFAVPFGLWAMITKKNLLMRRLNNEIYRFIKRH